MITYATALVPIRHPNRFPILGTLDAPIDEYDGLLRTYINQLFEAMPLIENDITVTSVELIKPTDVQLKQLNSIERFFLPPIYDFIEISASYKNDIEAMRKNNPHMKDLPDAEVVQHSAACVLAQGLEKIHFFSELAFPGLLDISSGLAYEGDQPVIAIKKKGTFRFILEQRVKKSIEWPAVKELTLSEVISWAQKIEYGNGFYAKSRMQRALALFGHAISLGWHREGESLFRIMQGLESFYTNGTGDLRNQLSEKTKLFLDAENLQGNLVGKLYDLRSKFIHGAAVITYPDGIGYELEEEEKSDEKSIDQFNQAVELGYKLLLASIQKCISENFIDVAWGYNYVGKRG